MGPWWINFQKNKKTYAKFHTIPSIGHRQPLLSSPPVQLPNTLPNHLRLPSLSPRPLSSPFHNSPPPPILSSHNNRILSQFLHNNPFMCNAMPPAMLRSATVVVVLLLLLSGIPTGRCQSSGGAFATNDGINNVITGAIYNKLSNLTETFHGDVGDSLDYCILDR